MNLFDPVDAAALRMFNETSAYIFTLKFGDTTADPTAMIAATQAYAEAVEVSLEREAGRERWLSRESTTEIVGGAHEQQG